MSISSIDRWHTVGNQAPSDTGVARTRAGMSALSPTLSEFGNGVSTGGPPELIPEGLMTLDPSALENTIPPITGSEGACLASSSSRSWSASCRRLASLRDERIMHRTVPHHRRNSLAGC